MHQNCRGWGSAPDHAQGAYSDPDIREVCGWERQKWYEICEFTDRVGEAVSQTLLEII